MSQVCRNNIYDQICSEPTTTNKKCSLCGEYINVSDEYVENYAGDFAHYECVGCSSSVLEWLGYEVRTMEDE
jgi:ribosomal protein S27E|nr:MAG TPA: zinc-ribbon domain protein [Caudoviricetes sp.]